MHQSLYYGEIAAHITDRLYQYPDRIMQIDRSLNLSDNPDETLFTLVGQSAHIFATVQDLFDDEPLNWMKAVELYADNILESLLIGNKPQTINFLQMVTQSIQALH